MVELLYNLVWLLLMNSSAGAWSKWETATSKLLVDPAYIQKSEDPKW